MRTYAFLICLLLGFALVGASAFTAAYSRRWGEQGGQLATIILRNVLGIPLWLVGFLADLLYEAMAWLAGPETYRAWKAHTARSSPIRDSDRHDVADGRSHFLRQP